MIDELKNVKNKPVILACGTQIEIEYLRSIGKSYNEIDVILDVPSGSSKYTMKNILGGVVNSGT